MTDIKIDLSLCVGCGGCNILCPYGILDLGDGQAVVVTELLENCIECSICEEGCPEKAIKVKTC
jgi:NAD-dependent dihydropyrimidine dehydrogenase PreA subunit